jgi:outer membrane receptor protein involved in Fe transport
MKTCGPILLIVGLVLLAVPAGAQDYRGRVQGSVVDVSQGALPGTTVTLVNDATAVAAIRITDAEGRYLFDFVEPGVYSITAELQGFKKANQRNVRVPQRGDVTANLSLSVGGIEETIIVTASPAAVQFTTSSSDLTLNRQLVDQIPLSGRNPYNLSTLDPTLTLNAGNPNENRPYHHAYANEYDAGGGTRRANDVLLDGVPLGASFKTAYTPSMDAVEEVTISKNSVDAENGHSLGGIISLNMKSGTNIPHGSGYYYLRRPGMNSVSDPTLVGVAGQDPIRGTDLNMYGGSFGGPIRKNKIFSFTSYEKWNDNRPLSIVRTVPTELERRGDFSQSVLSGRVRTIYDPFSSTISPITLRVVRTPFAGNVIPQAMLDPVALRMLTEIPLPNVGGNVDNWQGSVYEKTDYWNFSQRVDLNVSNDWRVFARYGQFKANLAQENPTDAGFLPLIGSNRYGMSTAADSLWVLSTRTTLDVRGSYYNMTDEFYNPSLLLGADGLQKLWPNNAWYSSLYNSGYVYYPALDVTSGTSTTSTVNRLGRLGREHFQRPDAWTLSARMNRYQGRHDLKWGGETRAYFGEAARFEPINLVFNSALTANSSDSPDVVGTGNQWATFMLGALDNGTSARLVPLQNPDLHGYAAYLQDDFRVNDRLTMNLGLRWEYEPGPTDRDHRLSQQIDLTQPIPEMQATPPSMPAQATQLMSSKGYGYTYNGAWIFTTADSPHAWHSTPWNFLPRAGVNYRLSDTSVLRAAYARYLMPTSNVRDTLGDFVEQYAGYQQFTPTLGLANGVPKQVLNDPYPAGVNPVIEPYGQSFGRYTNLGGTANLDQYELRPQRNDRFSVSYQKEMLKKTVFEIQYFFNRATGVPFDKNLNMTDPAFRYEQKTLLNTQVANPFRNYLTPDKFPGPLRNTATVTLGSLLVPYPQYTQVIQRNTDGGREMRTQTFEARAQRPFIKGSSFLVAYAFNHEQRQEWFDDLAQYRIFQTGEGWEWRPTNSPRHRVTTAFSWQVPVGRGRTFGSNLPIALDAVVGGWQVSPSAHWYSGRLLFFGTSYIVDGDPTLDSPTRDKWFDTSKFKLQDTFTPRTNPWFYDGLTGPGAASTDLTVTKMFSLSDRNRIELRVEAYNLFNQIVWEDPDLNIANVATFGKVTRKRLESSGREMQIGLRFLF